MKPRLSISRKWTPLPPELMGQIRTVFRQNFSTQIGDSTVEADGQIYPEEILVRVGIRSGNALKQNNWEISLGYKRNKDNVLKLLHLAVDAAASLFEQFFAAENDHDFPRIWEEVDFEGRKIFIQYSTLNSNLEAEADRILGDNASENLVQGDLDDVEVDLATVKAALGIMPDDDGGVN